jgi:RimJ/RimL family protein N-acetyltransferase
MNAAAPTLQTERLRLRWLSMDDADLMLAVWNEPTFVRYVGDRGIRTLDEARSALAAGPLKLYDDYGYGPYRMTAREGGAAMGTCGLFRRENLDDPDIGFALLPEYWGKGYALEAATAVVTHARDAMRLERLTAIVSPENRSSIKLIEKLGLSREGPIRMPGEDSDVLLYGVDWPAQ